MDPNTRQSIMQLLKQRGIEMPAGSSSLRINAKSIEKSRRKSVIPTFDMPPLYYATIDDNTQSPFVKRQRQQNISTLRNLSEMIDTNRYRSTQTSPLSELTLPTVTQSTIVWKEPKPKKLCSLTMQENAQVQMITQRADKLLRNPHNQVAMPDIDAQQELIRAQKAISEMNMILNRLMPIDDRHSTIYQHTPVKIFVIPNNVVVYKIPCRAEPSPCKIKFKYLDPKVKGLAPDVTVWVSQTEPSPADNKCDIKEQAPSSIIVNSPDKRATFKTSYNIYVAFFSVSGANVQVSIKFIDVTAFRKKLVKKAIEMTPEQIAESEAISKELMEGFQRSRHKYRIDFVKANRNSVSRSPSPTQRDWHDRSQQVFCRRNSEQMQRKKFRLAISVKWQFVRKRRAEMLIIKDKTRDNLNRMTTLCHAMKFLVIYKRILEQITLKIMLVRKKRQFDRRIQLLIDVLQAHIMRYSETTEQRLKLQLKYEIQAQHMVFDSKCGPKAEANILKALEQAQFNNEMIAKTRRTHGLIVFVQNQYLKHKESIESRLSFLMYGQWDAQLDILQSFFLTKKTKEFKKTFRALTQVSSEAKLRVCRLYLARQSLLHTLRFLQWMIVHRKANYTPETLKQMKKDLTTRAAQMYEIDQVLFTNKEVPKLTGIDKIIAAAQKKVVPVTDMGAVEFEHQQSLLEESQKPKVVAKKPFTQVEWTSHARIAALMSSVPQSAALLKQFSPNLKSSKKFNVTVPDSNKFQYQIAILETPPSFVFVAQGGLEIVHRLILRAALTESGDELTLSKSQC